MTRRLTILALSTILMLAVTQLLAHERFRIVGTVTKRTATEIEVKTKGDKKVGMDFDEKTVFLRDKKKVPVTAVKVGSSVVIDALGHDESDLVAEVVRLVPPIPASPAKQAPR